jgi:hypothetical protein
VDFGYHSRLPARLTIFSVQFMSFSSTREYHTSSTMTTRNVAFDDLLARMTTLYSHASLASREGSNLANGFRRLDGPLTRIREAGGDAIIDPTDRTLIDDEWVALRDMTYSAVGELEAGFSEAETQPSVTWLKICFIRALFHAEKLYVLVDSVLRHRRPGWERLVVFVGNNELHQEDTGLLTSV